MAEYKVDDIQNLCINILVSAGAEESEANIIVRDYLETEMSGHHSHGLAHLYAMVETIQNRGHYELEKESDAVTVINGHSDIAHVVVEKFFEYQCYKATQQGMSALVMHNIGELVTPAPWCRRAAEAGFASMFLEYGGWPLIAPPGKKDPVTSTNPIGISYPRSNGEHFVLDMALSVRANHWVRLAGDKNEEVPLGWALDKDGIPTTVPSEKHSVAPLGGYKGFALSFMLEMLTGPMLGVPAGKSGDLSRRGIICFLFDPNFFGSTEEEREVLVEQLVNDLDGAQYPGEKSGQLLRKNSSSDSIEIDDAIYQKLLSLLP